MDTLLLKRETLLHEQLNPHGQGAMIDGLHYSERPLEEQVCSNLFVG